MTQSETSKSQSFEEVIQSQGYIVYTCIGYSMLPLLRQRKDIVEVKAKGPERCKKYDIVLYKREDRYILHRILKVLPDGYIIAGDHNAFLEKDVTDDMILGVMTRVVRDGKTITSDDFWYKVYVHLWCDAYPVRMGLLKVKWKIKPYIRKCMKFVKRRILRTKK